MLNKKNFLSCKEHAFRVMVDDKDWWTTSTWEMYFLVLSRNIRMEKVLFHLQLPLTLLNDQINVVRISECKFLVVYGFFPPSPSPPLLKPLCCVNKKSNVVCSSSVDILFLQNSAATKKRVSKLIGVGFRQYGIMGLYFFHICVGSRITYAVLVFNVFH